MIGQQRGHHWKTTHLFFCHKSSWTFECQDVKPWLFETIDLSNLWGYPEPSSSDRGTGIAATGTNGRCQLPQRDPAGWSHGEKQNIWVVSKPSTKLYYEYVYIYIHYLFNLLTDWFIYWFISFFIYVLIYLFMYFFDLLIVFIYLVIYLFMCWLISLFLLFI